MKLEGNSKLKIKNIANGRMVLASLALENGETFEVNPILLTDATKKEIEYFIATGQLEVSIADVEEADTKKASSKSNVLDVETVKNDKGETHKHTVYDPDTASKNRAITVETIETAKGVEVSSNKIDQINFLEKHWKTIEKELSKITSLDVLRSLLSVAIELGMEGNKKHELIEDRISELK